MCMGGHRCRTPRNSPDRASGNSPPGLVRFFSHVIQRGLPPGWDEDRVQEVLAHYEAQTEDEAVAEFMEIPTALVPKVRALIASCTP